MRDPASRRIPVPYSGLRGSLTKPTSRAGSPTGVRRGAGLMVTPSGRGLTRVTGRGGAGERFLLFPSRLRAYLPTLRLLFRGRMLRDR